MSISPNDVRMAAAQAITNLIQQRGDILRWSEIAQGFQVGEQRLLFANKARGIFKPAALEDGAALSIRSSRPSRRGRFARYEDELFEDGLLRYKLQGWDPRSADPLSTDNRMLHEAMKRKLPLIYFSGLADSTYQVFFPVIVTNIDPHKLEATMAWKTEGLKTLEADSAVYDPLHHLGKRTAVNQLHHARFRAGVFAAYDFKCALSGAPIGSLLTAARILPGAEASGVPEFRNAICMSVLHRAAFDANLIGINPNRRVVIGDLLNRAEHADMKRLIEGSLVDRHVAAPKFRSYDPDPECLKERYRLFEVAQD